MSIKVFVGLSGGLCTRTVPIVKLLQERYDCEVAFSVYGNESIDMLEDLGFKHLPDTSTAYPNRNFLISKTKNFYNLDHYYSQLGFLDYNFAEDWIMTRIKLIKEYKPDLIIADMSPHTLIAANFFDIPCVSVTQSCFHPQGEFLYSWGEMPRNLPKVTPVFNRVLDKLNLPLINKVEDLNSGDIDIIPSIPELDPIESHKVHYVGPITMDLNRVYNFNYDFPLDKPYILVYPGRLKDTVGNTGQKIVESVIKAFGNKNINILIASNEIYCNSDFIRKEKNIFITNYYDKKTLQNSDLFIHHGGHGSCMASIVNGIPSLIIPTHIEREYNARKMQKLKIADYLLPDCFIPTHLYQLAEFMINDNFRTNSLKISGNISKQKLRIARKSSRVNR